MHTALQTFHDTYNDRFPDLRIDAIPDDGGYLTIEWCDDTVLIDEITAFMFGDDEDPSFEVEDDTTVCEPDHFASAVEAFAWRLLDSDEFKDFLKTATDRSESEPGEFGALVWTKAIDLHLVEMVETTERLRLERARLNPTTVSDLPLFTEK